MAFALTDRFAELRAPAHWQAVDFISDLHLQATDPTTLDRWRTYLQTDPASRADALFILGDLFEVWIGDDALQDPNAFVSACAALLHAHSRHTPVYFMHGNRDFLLGPEAAEACGMQILEDPTVLNMHGQRWLLSHGDALCLDDTDYLRFRAQVRGDDWQTAFLSRPLQEREATARGIREQSEARKQASDPTRWVDVDAGAARDWLGHGTANTLIHGHTHRPAEHTLGPALRRVVLSDWDARTTPPRAEVLRLNATGLHRMPL